MGKEDSEYLKITFNDWLERTIPNKYSPNQIGYDLIVHDESDNILELCVNNPRFYNEVSEYQEKSFHTLVKFCVNDLFSDYNKKIKNSPDKELAVKYQIEKLDGELSVFEKKDFEMIINGHFDPSGFIPEICLDIHEWIEVSEVKYTKVKKSTRVYELENLERKLLGHSYSICTINKIFEGIVNIKMKKELTDSLNSLNKDYEGDRSNTLKKIEELFYKYAKEENTNGRPHYGVIDEKIAEDLGYKSETIRKKRTKLGLTDERYK